MVSHARRGISQDSDIRYCVELLKLGSCRNLASYLWGKNALSNFQEVAEAHGISKTRLAEALILYASDIPYDELVAIIVGYLQD
jgi:hypothetical protein